MVVVVPTLGELGRRYGIGYAEAQFLISAYLFGLGAAQPFSGMLCDRFGRRPVLLTGFAIFVAASVGCALADRLDVLIALRFLQAAGVSVGTVATRAIVRDTHDEAGTVRALSVIAAAMGIAPVIAPVAGGLLGASAGPQSVFLLSAALGGMVWLRVALRLRETVPPETQHGTHSLAQLIADYGTLLRAREFMGYTLMYGMVQGGFFAFLAVGAAIFENDLGIGQRGFGIIWSGMALAYVGGAALNSRLVRSRGTQPTLRLGIALTVIAGVLILAVALGPGHGAFSLIGLLALLTAASGLVIPGAMAGSVSYRPEIAGTSSGLSSALGLIISGGFSIISGSIYAGVFTPVAILIAIACVLTAATAWMVRAPQTSEP